MESGYVVERNRKHLYKFEPKSKFEIQDATIELTESENAENRTNITENNNIEDIPATQGEREEGRPKRQIKRPKYLEEYVTLFCL